MNCGNVEVTENGGTGTGLTGQQKLLLVGGLTAAALYFGDAFK